jgi:putative transposase
MMTNRQLPQYFSNLGLPPQAQSFISIVRDLNSSASTRSAGRPAPWRFASGKMRRVISFEGMDLPWVLALEAASSVLEYMLELPTDKPPPGNEHRQSSKTPTTPYFFVLWEDAAGWADCLTDDDLAGIATRQPGRYCRDTSGRWRCPIGEAFARPLGFCYRVLTPKHIIPAAYEKADCTKTSQLQLVDGRIGTSTLGE